MTESGDRESAAPPRILIVDDEPLNADYLKQELEDQGFVTERAGDGIEALERIAARAPDLILLDVMMPRMDGISALRALKSDPETRLIPVVLMTALNAVEDRVRGIEAGADDFLSKPVDERELLARIRTALGLKRAIDEAVGELRSTSAHLERYGNQERNVAVLVVDWRLAGTAIPDAAVGFLGRHHRDAAERRVVARGGMVSEDDGTALLAVFEGPDDRSRSLAAVETGLAVVGEGPVGSGADASARVKPVVAVGVGLAEVGSTRVSAAGESRWVFRAAGEPVDRTAALARGAVAGEVLVTAEAAALLSDRFTLEPLGDRAYRVLAPTVGEVEPLANRSIRAILVTDIVGSTRTAERVGDGAWSELLATHDGATRDELLRFGGDEINTTGDGFLAAFESPTRAIRCALAVMDRVRAVGLTIRAGIHTGEVEQLEGRTLGITLSLATRVAERADPGELLVNATTRELAAGSGLRFRDRGDHALKGVAEPRRLYAASETQSSEPRRASEPAGPVEFPAGLTAREVDVLRLVAMGLSDAEVAEELVVSVRTVNAHLRSVYRKAGVRSRAAAGRFAEENRLLS